MPLISEHPQKQTIIKALRENKVVLERQLNSRMRCLTEDAFVIRAFPSLYITKIGSNWQVRNVSLAQHGTQAEMQTLRDRVLAVFDGAVVLPLNECYRDEIKEVERLIKLVEGAPSEA